MNRTSPTLAALDALMSRADVDLVAKPLLEPVVRARAFLTAACENAARVISVDAGTPDDLPSMSEVVEKVAAVKKDIALVTNMLAACSSAAARRAL